MKKKIDFFYSIFLVKSLKRRYVGFLFKNRFKEDTTILHDFRPILEISHLMLKFIMNFFNKTSHNNVKYEKKNNSFFSYQTLFANNFFASGCNDMTFAFIWTFDDRKNFFRNSGQRWQQNFLIHIKTIQSHGNGIKKKLKKLKSFMCGKQKLNRDLKKA